MGFGVYLKHTEIVHTKTSGDNAVDHTT